MINLFGGGKKEELPPKTSGHGSVPVEKVKELSAKGFSEVEIIDVLRKEGYSPKEIDQALTLALKSRVEEPAPKPKLPTLQDLQQQAQVQAPVMNEPQPLQALPQNEQQTAPIQEPVPDVSFQQFQQTEQQVAPQIPFQSLQPESYPAAAPSEEVIEAIVKEKMSELEKRLTQFKMHYAELDRKMKEIHHRLDSLAEARSKEQEEIMAKLDAMKDLLSQVEGKVSSLEKAFKETLPALIESVRALSELVERIKGV